MTDRDLMKQAVEAMEYADACLKKQLTTKTKHEYAQDLLLEAGTALRERLAQPNEFNPDWDAMAVIVEEQQRMAKRIAELEAQPEQEPVVDERIKSVRHMRDVQGYDGNWNYDPYMQGLYNGLEFALSLLEVRQPEFKDAPATWLGDVKFKRDKLSSRAAHDTKENT